MLDMNHYSRCSMHATLWNLKIRKLKNYSLRPTKDVTLSFLICPTKDFTFSFLKKVLSHMTIKIIFSLSI